MSKFAGTLTSMLKNFLLLNAKQKFSMDVYIHTLMYVCTYIHCALTSLFKTVFAKKMLNVKQEFTIDVYDFYIANSE
jgi:hypothetical protein